MQRQQSHQRTQALLLISKLLDNREGASPFTLVIDTVEQAAHPLLQEFIGRAKNTKSHIVFVAFETLRSPKDVDTFLPAYSISKNLLQEKIKSAIATSNKSRCLVIFDTLHCLASDASVALSSYLSSLIAPSTSLVAVYHTDQPLSSSSVQSPYKPQPLKLLKFLATTIIAVHSCSHILKAKAARDRSLAAPAFGLLEDDEGTLQGIGANDSKATVVECEMRRKSGRTVELWFVLEHGSILHSEVPHPQVGKRTSSTLTLLDEYPPYSRARGSAKEPSASADDGITELSFSLGLTEKQRKDRSDVVLPYYDAQNGDGAGEGGRILYDMGEEDDFDDEEDEI